MPGTRSPAPLGTGRAGDRGAGSAILSREVTAPRPREAFSDRPTTPTAAEAAAADAAARTNPRRSQSARRGESAPPVTAPAGAGEDLAAVRRPTSTYRSRAPAMAPTTEGSMSAIPTESGR